MTTKNQSGSSSFAIDRRPFGKADGRDVELLRLENGKGMVLEVFTLGATVRSLLVPDRTGRISDVVLGFDDLDGYLAGCPYFGATAGRVANRIRHGRFELDGKSYSLVQNDGPHHLHGGIKGWDKVVWNAEAMQTADGPAVRFTLSVEGRRRGIPRRGRPLRRRTR